MSIYAVYVRNTSGIRYADAIVQGYKLIETRSRDTLGKLVGERVLIVRTRAGHEAEVIGAVTITGKQFVPAADFGKLFDKHLVPPGSKFDAHGRGKWCYDLANAEAFDKATPLSKLGVIAKNRSYATIATADD